MSTQVPEGWYPDPQQPSTPGAERWWNGYQWTAHTRSVTPEQPPPPQPQPTQPQQSAPYGVPSYPTPAGQAPQQSAPYGADDPGWRPQPTPPGRGSVDLPDGRRLADIGSRALSYFLDLVIAYVAVAPVRLVLGALDDGLFPDHRFLVAFNLRDSFEGVAMLVVYVAYQVAFLRSKGATPGRMMAGTRVETEPGSTVDRPDLGALVLRALVLAGPFYPQTFPVLGVFGYFLPLVAIVQAANDQWRQGLHDKGAHTVVVSRPR